MNATRPLSPGLEPEPLGPSTQGAAAPRAEGKRARVLIVDDDEHNLLAIRTVLEDIAARDPDPGIRELAGEKASDLLIHATAAGQASALTRLKNDRDLGEVVRRASSADTLRTDSGNATFCATVMCGNSE